MVVTWVGDVLAVAVGLWLGVAGVAASLGAAWGLLGRRRRRAAVGVPLVEFLRRRGMM